MVAFPRDRHIPGRTVNACWPAMRMWIYPGKPGDHLWDAGDWMPLACKLNQGSL